IHVIDMLRAFGRGSVRSVTPLFRWETPGWPVVVAGIEFSSGDRAVYEGIWEGPGPWAVSVTTQARRWELRPLEQAAVMLRGERRLRPVEADEQDQRFKPGFRLQAEHAAAAALGRPSASPTLDEALETMELIRAIYGG